MLYCSLLVHRQFYRLSFTNAKQLPIVFHLRIFDGDEILNVYLLSEIESYFTITCQRNRSRTEKKMQKNVACVQYHLWSTTWVSLCCNPTYVPFPYVEICLYKLLYMSYTWKPLLLFSDIERKWRLNKISKQNQGFSWAVNHTEAL